MSEPTPIRSAAPAGAPAPGGNGGNGETTRHRLGSLERRMDAVEKAVKEVNDTCIEIRTLIKTLMWGAGGLAVIASIVIHVMLRQLPG